VSVPVDLDALQSQTEQFGPLAFVVTVNDTGRPHVVSAAVEWHDGQIEAGAGRRTAANIGDRPAVTLLWAPYEDGGYSLLVDGVASLDGERLRIRPEAAILHRTATSDTGRRVSDCAEVAPDPA